MLLEIIWFVKYILEALIYILNDFWHCSKQIYSPLINDSPKTKLSRIKNWRGSYRRNTYRLCVNPHLIHEDKLAEFSKG